jgi:hypothetical protein
VLGAAALRNASLNVGGCARSAVVRAPRHVKAAHPLKGMQLASMLLMSNDVHQPPAIRSGRSSRVGKAGAVVSCAAALLVATQLGDDEPLGPNASAAGGATVPAAAADADREAFSPGSSPPEPRAAGAQSAAEIGTISESQVVRTSGQSATPTDSLNLEGVRIEGDALPPPRAASSSSSSPTPSVDGGAPLVPDAVETAAAGASGGVESNDIGMDDAGDEIAGTSSLESEEPTESLVPRSDCGLISCEAGYVCCNPSCGTCVPEGDTCDRTPCVPRVQYPVSIICGRSTCSVGQVCCNQSCGTCTAPGDACDTTPCDNPIQYPISIPCGRSTCSNGQVCCNATCGTCVAPGQTCSPEVCG